MWEWCSTRFLWWEQQYTPLTCVSMGPRIFQTHIFVCFVVSNWFARGIASSFCRQNGEQVLVQSIFFWWGRNGCWLIWTFCLAILNPNLCFLRNAVFWRLNKILTCLTSNRDCMQYHPKNTLLWVIPTLADSCDIVSDIPSGFTYGLGSSSITKFSLFFRPYILGIWGRLFDSWRATIWQLFDTYLALIWQLFDILNWQLFWQLFDS